MFDESAPDGISCPGAEADAVSGIFSSDSRYILLHFTAPVDTGDLSTHIAGRHGMALGRHGMVLIQYDTTEASMHRLRTQAFGLHDINARAEKS